MSLARARAPRSPHDGAMASMSEHYALRAGTALRIGSLVWPRPYFPTLHERASLIAEVLPAWAIASGRTAGWVWTGMGQPEPWSVLRPAQPAPSPLERMEWGARTLNPVHHPVQRIQGLRLVTPEATAVDILLHDSCPDVAGAQVVMLSSFSTLSLRERCHERRMTQRRRRRLERLLSAVDALRERYPDITR